VSSGGKLYDFSGVQSKPVLTLTKNMEIGDKVTCINDDFSNVIDSLKQTEGCKFLNFPKKDHEYTVREIFDNNGIVTSILLEEIVNQSFKIPILNTQRELSFADWRFTKLKTGIIELYAETSIAA
jgi:hypothetical protein